MAENSNIEWTDSTFNPWIGCDKVSPGCDHCYAESLMDTRWGKVQWGKDGTRVVTSDDYWKKPEAWERGAAAFQKQHGRRRRVFCASLADVFENRPDLASPRLRLFDLIRRTPSLDWLLLTKRPKNVVPLLRLAYEDANAECNDPADDESNAEHVEYYLDLTRWLDEWISGDYPPANVWLGTSVEDQERADQRVPALLRVPAAVRFLSMEPLLGPVNLHRWLFDPVEDIIEPFGRGPVVDYKPREDDRLHWIIVGGESGHGARPMHPDWARSLRDQCADAGVPMLFKQWGEWAPASCFGCEDEDAEGTVCERCGSVAWADWPSMLRVGKKAAGRMLDGRTHDGFPAQTEARP